MFEVTEKAMELLKGSLSEKEEIAPIRVNLFEGG